MFRRYIVLFLAFVSLVLMVHGQPVDTVYQLEGVNVGSVSDNDNVTAIAPTQILTKDAIQALPVVQLSDVLKLFSGIVIRDYGGVGGMKTVAVRGFGSQHTAVSYDGILVTDCQTGQIDLSKFLLDHVDKISLNYGPGDGLFVPARMASSASTILIETHRPVFSRSRPPIHLDFHFTGGSFGLINPVFCMENKILGPQRKVELLSSFSLNYLQSKGNYPFTLYYGGVGDSTSLERRSNSDIKTLTAEENLFFQFRNLSNMRVKLYYYQSERGLPGAVIFYKVSGGQRLYDQNAFGQVNYIHPSISKNLSYQLNAKFSFAKQRYYDPTYLNESRYLHNVYLQREYYLSNALLYQVHRMVSLSFANDLIYSNMTANLNDFAFPSRMQILTTAAVSVNTRYVESQIRLFHTGLLNWVRNGDASDNISRFCPSAAISVRPIASEHFHIRAFYQNIFRLPTFNDLYYSEVGNRNLRPENTHQIDVGVTYSKSITLQSTLKESINKKVFHFNLVLDGYYNRVKDKIVAIPSKNLFVWTMLNFGRVLIAGVDFNGNFGYQYGNYSVTLDGCYSLQYAIDRTNSSDKTYGHQIPYTPRHSGSVSLNVQFPYHFAVGYALVAAGKRYALQQNVAENELSPYTDHSLSLEKIFDVKGMVELRIKGEMLNMANKHYEIIRNFPMQGRSFRLTFGVKW